MPSQRPGGCDDRRERSVRPDRTRATDGGRIRSDRGAAARARLVGRGTAVFVDADRRRVDALCRQIDVRRKVSEVYDDGWKRREPETPVSAETMAGVVAVLLANAGPISTADATSDDGGWGLKCANSALTALELRDTVPEAASLRAWALAVLDHRTGMNQ